MNLLSESWTGTWYCVDVIYYDWESDYEEPTNFEFSGFAGATLSIDPNGTVRFETPPESEIDYYDFEVKCSGDTTLCVNEIDGCFDTFTNFSQTNGRLEFIARLAPDATGGDTDSLVLTFTRSKPESIDPNDIVKIATILEVDEIENILENAEEKERGTLTKWSQTLWEATVAGEYPSGKAVNEEEELFFAYLQNKLLDFLSEDLAFDISFNWLTHDLVRRGLSQLDPSKEIFSSESRLDELPYTFVDLVKHLPVHEADATLAEAMGPAWFPYFDPNRGPEAFFTRPIFSSAFHEFWSSKES